MLDLVIRGGLVVTPEEVGERDIGIQNGTIVAIAMPGALPTEAAQVIEAQSHIVLPGGIAGQVSQHHLVRGCARSVSTCADGIRGLPRAPLQAELLGIIEWVRGVVAIGEVALYDRLALGGIPRWNETSHKTRERRAPEFRGRAELVIQPADR